MTSWLNFLTEQGARFEGGERPASIHFRHEDTEQTIRSNFVTPLVHQGLMAADGEEAAAFLHNQLTNDVLHLPDHQARLAGYCSAKGRLLASLLIWKTGQRILLQIPHDIQATVQKRLSMFILRSKAKLSDVSDQLVSLGLAGPAVASALLPWFSSLPLAIHDKIDGENGSVIRHPDAGGVPRYQWITTPAQAAAAWPQLTAILQAAGSDAWNLTEIESGTPYITTATQEQFVPQMINFELIGGVNFKKGCYPGQEIVARSQYLGKLKRRMVRATITAAEAAPGTEIFSSADAGQPCGMIVNSARIDATMIECLAEIKLAAVDQDVRLGSADGPALTFLPLPYQLTDPV